MTEAFDSPGTFSIGTYNLSFIMTTLFTDKVGANSIFRVLQLSKTIITIKKTQKIMSGTKKEVESLLSNLPDDCSLEDVQYHLYVIEKVRHGLKIHETTRNLIQEEAEGLLSKWVIK
ncbi:hypothetical protein [Planktothrix prolifica]|uniref:hypothetical protein n=1 Tax=Planktothrix prolifica TaxID=54307 RepID=UPI001ED9893A|nr:hypothetical protein [Planktothrix prolifica]